MRLLLLVDMNRRNMPYLVLSQVVEDLIDPGENLLSSGGRLQVLLDLTSSGREVLLFDFNLKMYGGKLAKH